MVSPHEFQKMHTCIKKLAIYGITCYYFRQKELRAKVFQCIKQITGLRFEKQGAVQVEKVAYEGEIQKYLLRFTVLIFPVCCRKNILQMKEINLQLKDSKNYVTLCLSREFTTSNYHLCISTMTTSGYTYSSSEVCEK